MSGKADKKGREDLEGECGDTRKRGFGQYDTTRNPFSHSAFVAWAAAAGLPKAPLLEPFAGANNLVRMLQAEGLVETAVSFDLDPRSSDVAIRDTLSDFPTGFGVVVTNPPWLARNSASRRGLAFPATGYDDLYKHALAICLDNVRWLAAIVPESFVTTGLFRPRLRDVISLPEPMFDDTEHPVCLALWGEGPGEGKLWSGATCLGQLSKIEALRPASPKNFSLDFNSPSGRVGLRALDDTRGASIRFCRGAEIASVEVKHSSRALTRISGGGLDGMEERYLDAVILEANAILSAYRAGTQDALMTSFKGLRADGKYRRRLDFATARAILETALAAVAARVVVGP